VFSAAAWSRVQEPVVVGAGGDCVGDRGLGRHRPYVVAVSGIGGFADLGVEINLVMHVVGSAVVLAIVLVPSCLNG
jgi:hypothetical protein